MNEHPEFGRLILKPELKGIEIFTQTIVWTFRIFGSIFILYSLLKFSDISKISNEMMFFYACLISSGFLMWYISNILSNRESKVKFEIYEHGYIDHFFTTGGIKERKVKSYCEEDYVLYGISKSGKKEEIISSGSTVLSLYFVKSLIVDLREKDVIEK